MNKQYPNKKVYMSIDELASGFVTKYVQIEGEDRVKQEQVKQLRENSYPDVSLSHYFNGTDKEIKSFLTEQKKYAQVLKDKKMVMRNVTGVVSSVSYEKEEGADHNQGYYSVSLYTKSRNKATVIYVLNFYEKDMISRDLIKVLDQIELGKVYRFSFSNFFELTEENEPSLSSYLSVFTDQNVRLLQTEENKVAFRTFSKSLLEKEKETGIKATKLDYNQWHKEHFFDNWLAKQGERKNPEQKITLKSLNKVKVINSAQVSYKDCFTVYKDFQNIHFQTKTKE
jgi:hypothetical protein